jgi:hypothetical protein
MRFVAMKSWPWGLLGAAAVTAFTPIAGAAPDASTRATAARTPIVHHATAWVPVKSLPLKRQFGEFPERAPQQLLGRLKLERVERVSSAVIRGKRIEGDLLVIGGKYQNLTSQASYWSEGLAFSVGGSPRRCTINTCGVRLPEGDWRLTRELAKPVVDYPRANKVPAKGTVSFREAIPVPPGLRSSIRSFRDVWLLPIYLANNYYDLPYDFTQFVRLSTYLGRTG